MSWGNREVKFKYYLETKHNDGNSEERFISEYTLNQIWSGAYTHKNLKTIACCQYIGQKDKNGKEIYEGDIVLTTIDGDVSVHEVKWFGADGYPAFDLWPPLDVDANGLSHCAATNDHEIEIIGYIPWRKNENNNQGNISAQTLL